MSELIDESGDEVSRIIARRVDVKEEKRGGKDTRVLEWNSNG